MGFSEALLGSVSWALQKEPTTSKNAPFGALQDLRGAPDPGDSAGVVLGGFQPSQIMPLDQFTKPICKVN